MEGIANFSEYLKENLETLGGYTEKVVESMNENIQHINESSTLVDNTTKINEQSTDDNVNNDVIIKKDDKKVIKSNTDWKNSIGTKIDNLLESAKTQKAVEDNKDLHFLHFVTESQKQEFENLEEKAKITLVDSFKSNKYFGTADVQQIWENALNPIAPTTNWMENMPVKYKESFNNLNENRQEEIKLQASVLALDTQYKVNHFWSTRDLRNVAVNVNESTTDLNINENLKSAKDAASEAYLASVKEGLAKRFKTNKY
jgi:hypothetical protein